MKKKLILTVAMLCMAFGLRAQLDIPDPPVFESASVVPGSSPTQVVLSWQPSDSVDVEGYVIYLVEDGITSSYDTVWGRLTTTYTNTASIAGGEPEKYRLAAIDTLENLSRLTDPHTTMYAFPYYEICDLEVRLDWTEYQGWDNVDHYDVYRKLAGESYSLLSTVDGNDSEFLDDELQPFSQYCYYVEAFRDDGISATSNETCVFTSSHEPPAYINADYASVENENIDLKFTVDTAGETERYKILRSVDSLSDFTVIHTISETEQPVLTYTDVNVIPDVHKYYYKLQAIDPCDKVSAESNHASNIVLKIRKDDMLNHHLSWDAYETWQGGVQEYRVYRHFGTDAPVQIVITDEDERSHKNNISDYVKAKHENDEIVPADYCYYVAGVEDASGNPLGMQSVSKSNEVCVSHQPRLYIPNAFYPNSYELENRVFKPMVSFARENAYRFAVYDRWGMEIFSTTDPTEAWDGTSGDRKAPPGRYVYHVSYTDFDGKEYMKSGIFLLYNE
ncbi:MAG: gliding motility-associated C-terminal domain-containing protein [Bacteroidota bacterium]